MLFEKIESAGLAHYSYIVGDGNEAVVIDPRTDIDVYLKKAVEQGYAVKYILETHRNEDYLIGSIELKQKTGADIFHADDYLDYEYGKSVEDGQRFKVGALEIKAIHTPGHTPGAFSYVLSGYEGEPWMVFTGDALFAGDVGRVDFLGEDKLEDTAGQLYDSIHEKILPLGDEVILCPAHGSGSVCASGIAQRNWTTIGIEKNLNPRLQYESREEFINEVGKMLEYPPYFEKMEKYNLKKEPLMSEYKKPHSLSASQFEEKLNKENTVILDTRMEVSFASAHIPGAISIWEDGIPSFAGWFISPEKKILLVNEGEFPETVVKYLYRIGFDRIEGYLSGGMVSWHMAGKKSESVSTVTVDKLCSIIDGSGDYFLLDIRSQDEIEDEGEIQEAEHIHITQIPESISKLPENRDIYIFCGSGLRSMTAASILKQKGLNNIKVVLGGLEGWSSTTCPIV
ncbi:MAG: MBL fold metallo-hydrolase [Bacillota bacterium]